MRIAPARLSGCLVVAMISCWASRGMAAREAWEMPREIEPASGHHGFMFMPYAGVHSFQNEDAQNMSVGLRMGSLLGGFLAPNLSLNGEITLDILNVNSVGDLSAFAFDATLSPLFHVVGKKAEFVLGPKLGLFAYSMSTGTGEDTKVRGVVYGANVGLLFPAGRASVGGLLSFTGRHMTKVRVCVTESVRSTCSDSPKGDDGKVLGFALAAMF